MPKVDRGPRPPKPPRIHPKCTWPHEMLLPELSFYEGSKHIVSSKMLDEIVHNLRNVEVTTSNMKYFRGDRHMRSCDPDLIWDVFALGRAIRLQRSVQVTVPPGQLHELHPATEPLLVLEDGSWIINGETGQCDNTASLAHADLIWYANEYRKEMGFNFCAGFAWQYAPAGHSPNWIVDNDLKFWIAQNGRARENYLIDPETVPGLKIHLIYEA